MFSNVQPEVSSDIPSQFSSEIGIRSNLERALMDYHNIKVTDVTASTATLTGFAATDVAESNVFLPSEFASSVMVSTSNPN